MDRTWLPLWRDQAAQRDQVGLFPVHGAVEDDGTDIVDIGQQLDSTDPVDLGVVQHGVDEGAPDAVPLCSPFEFKCRALCTSASRSRM